MKKGIAYIKVENVMKTLNQLASIFYGNPSHKLEVFAVTGTNGKSTVTSIIEDVYSHFKPCGYVGTIAIRYRDVVIPPTLTTPDPLTMQSALKDMCDADVKAVALEVSSHGLELGRTIGIDFDYAIFNDDNSLKMLIEYDGTQHQYGWGQKEESLQKIQAKDKFKEYYCLNNGIKLIRIPAKDYDKINEEYLNKIIKGE